MAATTGRRGEGRRGDRGGALGHLARGLDPAGRTGRAEFAAVAAAVALPWAALVLGPRLLPAWSRAHEAAAALPLALLLVPAAGHAMRRLNDAGWRRAWAALLLLPGARLLLAALLLLLPPGHRRAPPGAAGGALGLGVAGLAALLLAGSLAWATAPVLAAGMKPTLLPGDLVLLRRAPLDLARGDVVAFRLEGGEAPRLGRVLGLGGDRVAVAGGVPVLNGAAATQEPDGAFTETFGRQGPLRLLPACGNGAVGLGASCTTRRLREALPGGASHAVLDLGPRPRDEAAEVRVPTGRLFLLGDHRDLAEDSRVAPGARGAGLVPEAAVIGRAALVLASAAGAPWDPRGWRWGRVLERVE